MLWISHEENIKANALTKLTSTRAPKESKHMVETLLIRTIEKHDVSMVRRELSWMNNIICYKGDVMLPNNPTATQKDKHHQT